MTLTCFRCHQVKPDTEFQIDRSRKNRGHQAYCRSCRGQTKQGQGIRYRQAITLNLSDLDRGWLAGLLEGEGTFHIYRRPKRQTNAILIRMSSTDEDIIHKAHRLTGIGTVHAIRPMGLGKKPAWAWTIWSMIGVKAILEAILPLMGQRRTTKIHELQAEIAKREWISPLPPL